MKNCLRKRLKINEDTMTSIVIYSLIFCVIIVVASFIFAWFGKDTSSITASSLALFGTELGVCGAMKIFEKRKKRKDEDE